MYVGRIVAVGRTFSGRYSAMYRVSSRSFPNRHAVQTERAVAIIPKPGHENDVHKNPYIAYNCLRLVGSIAVATNGSHTDPITEKIQSGVPERDALASVLLAMDYEHDQLDTPRIASTVNSDTGSGFLAIVRKDGIAVREFVLEPGQAFYVCTYENNEPGNQYSDSQFDVSTADAACDYVLGQGVFANLERPVTAACALDDGNGGYTVAMKEAAQ
jgi:IMP cyclohydrolase